MDLFDYMRENAAQKSLRLLRECARQRWKKWLDSSISSGRISFYIGRSKRTS